MIGYRKTQEGGEGGKVLNNSFQGEDPTEANYNEQVRTIKMKKEVRTMQTQGITCKTGTKANCGMGRN